MLWRFIVILNFIAFYSDNIYMADSEISNYTDTLQQVLEARKDWLEKSEIVKLKDNLRAYQSSYATLYNIFLKKKIIDEDPYKHETKISELEVPESGAFQENKRLEQLSVRLSNFDNQLDFLVNFYQLGIDFLNLDRIKRIVGLVRYIDWGSLTPDNQSLMTKAVSDMVVHSKQGADPITLSIIGECSSKLSKTTSAAVATLKDLNVYYREAYKLEVRQKISKDMSAGEATVESIKKKFPSAMSGSPFYKELIEERIKEDYSKAGPDLRDALLNALKVAAEKPKVTKPAVNYKGILMDGIQVIGGASTSLHEIGTKLDENQEVLDSRKKGLIEAIKELIRQLTNAEPEEVIHNIEYLDTTKGVTVREKVNFHAFREDMDKKTKVLSSFVRGSAYNKLLAMSEEQIIGYLERNIRDVQTLHKTLNALDDFYKTHSAPDERTKIKGIKPELSALKNIVVKANQFRYEYSAQKEEEEQMKRLGINLNTTPATASSSSGPAAKPAAPAAGKPAAPAGKPAAPAGKPAAAPHHPKS
jgi:hypothetical protein